MADLKNLSIDKIIAMLLLSIDQELAAKVIRQFTDDGVDKVTVVDAEVDISEACATLAGWDGRFDADSVGAVVWREFLGSFNFASAKDYGPLFSVPFDADDPVATPNTLTPAVMGEPDKVLEGLGKAVQRLAEAGVAVDAALGAGSEIGRASCRERVSSPV